MTLVERSAVTILKFWIIVDKHAPASCCSEPFPYVAGTGCGAGAPAGRSVWGQLSVGACVGTEEGAMDQGVSVGIRVVMLVLEPDLEPLQCLRNQPSSGSF